MGTKKIIDFLLAAAIFGFSVVYIVPWLSGFIGNVAPASFKPYLPSSTKPAFTAQAIGQATVFGSFLALVLIGLRKVGVKKTADGIGA